MFFLIKQPYQGDIIEISYMYVSFCMWLKQPATLVLEGEWAAGPMSADSQAKPWNLPHPPKHCGDWARHPLLQPASQPCAHRPEIQKMKTQFPPLISPNSLSALESLVLSLGFGKTVLFCFFITAVLRSILSHREQHLGVPGHPCQPCLAS